jgi:hypothetical protein
MTISSTYGVLQQQISDEMGDRSDLLSTLGDTSESLLTLSPIQNAVQSAIAKWERYPFYFNELYDTAFFTCVSGQEFYTSSDAAAIATIASIDRLHVLVSANRYTLTPRTWQYLEDTSVNPAVNGFPADYAYFAERIRLYPIPDGAYPVTVSGTKRFTALSATTDANVWTQDAYDLIRSEAKLILALEVIHDPTLAAEMKLAIYGDPSDSRTRGYLSALKGETMRRGAKARIRPTSF